MSKTVDFGIDLGTTNSCIACCEKDGVRIFPNNDQMLVTPSAVYIHRSGRRLVGLRAQLAMRKDPENGVTEFKRMMGQNSPYHFKDARLSLSPEELSAEVLKSLREDVRRHAGVEVNTAVVTVPAAFGVLQCEATARAAQLAGIKEVHLLQEPIAAAIGYGVKPQERNQHWLVFDLGGGTLDIAVISTREGRLKVLEHQGNNLRGGKDIDRAIVEQILLPALSEQFDLAFLHGQGFSHPLMLKLRAEAERAKIALSTDRRVLIYLSDLGNDASGKPIEAEIIFTQEQLAPLVEPILEECVALARQALIAGRVPASGLDRILLVGGPTQMPLMRSRLSEELGAPVDFSLDPLTVVARGAALYAATLDCGTAALAPSATQKIPIKLGFEPVSAGRTCHVEGRVECALPGLAVEIAAIGGSWTSGWLTLHEAGFQADLPLKESEINVFRLSLRDGRGKILETEPPEFKVRNGLVPDFPPLPHSLSVEITGPQGRPMLDVVFARNTPLPAEKKVIYRTARALVPGKRESSIYIKFWEGEFLETPDANKLITSLELPHDGVRQRVPEGSEIHITVKIDASRLVSVGAYLPEQQVYFSNQIYIPEADASNYVVLARDALHALPELTVILQDLSDRASSTEEKEKLEEIRAKLNHLELNGSLKSAGQLQDTEEAMRFVAAFRDARGLLLRLRRQIGDNSEATALEQLNALRRTKDIVESQGDVFDKQTLAALTAEYERAIVGRHYLLIDRIAKEFLKLRIRVLARQRSYWTGHFTYLQNHDHPFANRDEAKRLIAKGRLVESDFEQLKEVVCDLWLLLPDDNTKEQPEDSGIRAR